MGGGEMHRMMGPVSGSTKYTVEELRAAVEHALQIHPDWKCRANGLWRGPVQLPLPEYPVQELMDLGHIDHPFCHGLENIGGGSIWEDADFLNALACTVSGFSLDDPVMDWNIIGNDLSTNIYFIEQLFRAPVGEILIVLHRDYLRKK